MKHSLIVILLSFLFCVAKAQDKPLLENDTISYAGKKFYINQEIKLGYGSGQNKEFIFLFYGSGLAGVEPLEATFAKRTLKVDKVYKQKGKFFFRAKVVELGATMGGKVFADIEGAIDNKEL